MILRFLRRLFRRPSREVEAPVAPPKPLRVRRRGTLPPLPKLQARK